MLPEQRKAILVLGPECSGTRLLTKILVEAGCAGSDEHHQHWDDHEFTETDELVVWRRSFPHDQKWPDVGEMTRRLWAAGYEVQVVVIVREHYSVAGSQVAHDYAADRGAAWGRINEALCRIFAALAMTGIPFIVVTYEGLVQRPGKVQNWLIGLLGLWGKPLVPVSDENAKYYEEGG